MSRYSPRTPAFLPSIVPRGRAHISPGKSEERQPRETNGKTRRPKIKPRTRHFTTRSLGGKNIRAEASPPPL